MVNKVVAIVQARLGSIRFPEKVLKKIEGKSLIEILFHRLALSKKVDQIVLATTTSSQDDKLAQIISDLGFIVFRGNETDVLDRYYNAAMEQEAQTIVRITGDCPIIDSGLVDSIITKYEKGNVDYASNTNPPTYPDGLDIEVFSFESLKIAHENSNDHYDREHVTPYIKTNDQFCRINILNQINYSSERWTVDEHEDFLVIKSIIDHFKPNLDFSWTEVLKLLKSNPEYFMANKKINRNEGASMGTGQKLWKRARKIIPGGNMLLSKRAEMFLPDKWPAYYEKAKGCQIWDLDQNKYIDMSIMGIGTNVLGYANDEIDNEVRRVIDNSNTSTFNCPEEVVLAEKLIEIHPWSDMARLARCGGEANAIAARIGRAASAKDTIAFCGYHGWHDWYLAANLSDSKNLGTHLLPGLEPTGVPTGLKGSSIPFNFNDLEGLKRIISNNNVGVIMMEVCRNLEPENNFLQEVRHISNENNIVLIFDEITSGFRSNVGGVHLEYGVDPDISIFGKTMGNGYAISAVIGRREVMEYAQSSFISSTFWTERMGPVAALKTIEIMERDLVHNRIIETGQYIKKCWQDMADQYNLEINISGISPIPQISFNSNHQLAIKTIITQEMLKQGFLAGNSVYVCIDHSKNIVDKYIDALKTPFEMVFQVLEGEEPETFLEGPICHGGFSRLN